MHPTAGGACTRGLEVLCYADVAGPTGSLNKELDGSMSPGTSKDEGGCLCVPVCLHDDCAKAVQRLGTHANRRSFCRVSIQNIIILSSPVVPRVP